MGTKIEKLQSWATSTDLQFMVLVIGPDEAKELLDANQVNRPLTDAAVARYAGFMDEGEWALTGEPLIFSGTGRLLNGQHRLHAIVRSKAVIEVVAIYGINESAFDKMDAGKNRTISDLIGVRGVPNHVAVASVAYALCKMKAGSAGIGLTNMNNYLPTKAIVVDVAMNNMEYVGRAAAMFSSHKSTGIVNGETGAALACMLAMGKEDVSKDFLVKLATGEGIVRGDPELAFRQKILDMKLRGAKIDNNLQLAYLVKSGAAKIKGAKITTLRMGDSESFPAMPGLDLLKIPKIPHRNDKFRVRKTAQ